MKQNGALFLAHERQLIDNETEPPEEVEKQAPVIRPLRSSWPLVELLSRESLEELLRIRARLAA